MPGIYVHIPFCKQACSYCNFHFSTSLRTKEDVLDAINKEIDLRQDYLADRSIDTLYFGGGTPSLLTADEINRIVTNLARYFSLSENMEITLEANPDDLTQEKLISLLDTPINRLSIGIQSFREEGLQLMNRAHAAYEGAQAIEASQQVGFTNITIDLIYGSPTLSDELWLANLQTAYSLGIPHISAYCLTVEPGTALNHWIEKGKVQNVDNEQAARQFQILMAEMDQNGYDHYEISNFCKPGHIARHNTAYWQHIPYLGLGPGAHSFNGTSRQWNVANNVKYAKSIVEEELISYEKEELSLTDQFNEYLLTSLRTKWGCQLATLSQHFPEQYTKSFQQTASRLEAKGLLEQQNGHITLTQQGTLLADQVIAELFAD